MQSPRKAADDEKLEDHWRRGIDVVVRWLRTGGTAVAVLVAIAIWGTACGQPRPAAAPALPDAIHARFLAGTDSGGGYPYNVPGFALHDELRIMARNGMPIADVLGTATVEPAIAMRREAELGTLEVGKRADLLLLAHNPLDAIANLEAIDGVMVRGIWLSRTTLDEMLAAIEAIDRGPAHPLIHADLDRVLETLEQLRARGYVLRDHVLGWLRFRLEAAHLPVDRPLFDGIAPLAPDED